MDKRCGFCGGSMVTVRTDALYCTTRCRVAGNRRKAREAGKFPVELTSKSRFVRWDIRARNGKDTKVPLTTAGRAASSTDPATWVSFDAARASSVGRGFGFVLGEGIGCIDLDDALIDGGVTPWAQAVLDANPNTFVEVSQSGNGLHVFGLLAEGPGRKIRDGRNIEWYSVGRYIALTGVRFGAAPPRLAPLVLPV